MKLKNKLKSVVSALLSASMLLSVFSTVSYASQASVYVDPADSWLTASGRTNELDMNSTTTYETSFCSVCNRDTLVLTYRVPEYTKSGTTALNRGVMYSDGTMIDGVSIGNLDDGTPGLDASYTTYHWTKSICQTCGTMNSIEGASAYNFNRNVYSLNSCDNNFYLDFDNTNYLPYNNKYHTTVLKKGKYCQFCKGTRERAVEKQELHHLSETVDAQLGNQRFHVTGVCDDCGYIQDEYAVAKSVVQSYYGKVDGKTHTVTVNDLSESGVHTSIRYGTEADKCNKTSAPNYTEEGYYPVYYAIDYSYSGESMTENGVSYVWLLADNSNSNSTSSDDTHTHSYHYLETIKPSCTELGYDRFQCAVCGNLQKTNYTPASGHDYDTVTVREASCQQGGLVLNMCKKCGNHYTENTPVTAHRYTDIKVAATCVLNGYTEHICADCGYKYITDLTPLKRHSYKADITEPTCETRGYTIYTCKVCDDMYVSDYTDALGHDWDKGHIVTGSTCESEGVMEFHCTRCREKMIKAISATGHTLGKAATCTEPQKCETCGAILELPTGHSYNETVTAPTCTHMGYSTYQCENCDNSYIGNYTDKAAHDYTADITDPTCTKMGYTTYTCAVCGDSYVSDYIAKTEHRYDATVMPATCTELGYTTYTCADCGDSYVSDYAEVVPHNYSKQTIEPTCTSQGYTIYTCPDCGKEYIGDEKEAIDHSFDSVITEPTCSKMGYTTYTCTDCGYSYVTDYTDAKGHDYMEEVTAPTCTQLGFTTHICRECGETHKSNYAEATGHKLSDWITDSPATIDSAGSKHIECVTCGVVLTTAVIPKLSNKDNSDEDGQSKVGDYSILITDKDNKPVFDSEVGIDKNDNITIRLPEGRLLSVDDITTITVTQTETQKPVQDINIFIADRMNNAATGKTDSNGQLKIPNKQSSTSDSSGTVTDDEKTYVVIATDKNGELIPNCDVEVGDNYSINVKLPSGTTFDNNNRVTVTVVTEKGEPVQGLRVQIIGSGDHIENGYTNIKGQVTMPLSNSALTDKDGSANVGEIIGDKIYDYIVKVSDEKGLVENALVTLTADNEAVLVCLPEGKVIDYYNRTTVRVTKADGTPIENWKVSVYNKDGSAIRTELTDEEGIVIVPPLSEAPITGTTPEPEPDKPDPLPGVTPSPDPSETPDPADKPDKPNTPDEPAPTPDLGDGAVVQNKNCKYRVYVWDNNGVIKEFGLIKLLENGELAIELPASKTLDLENRTNIRVVNENNGEPIKGITVTVNDNTGISASDLTNSQGIATVPVSDTDITDANGNAQVQDNNGNFYNINVSTEKKGNIEGAVVKVEDNKITVTLPDGTVIDYSDRTSVTVSDKDNTPVTALPVNVKDNKDGDRTESTDENGNATVPPLSEAYTDANGNAKVNDYTVIVEDTKSKIENVFVKLVDGKLNIELPDTHELTTSNQITVTVLDKDAKPLKDMAVIVTDKNAKTATKPTDTSGKITVPVKTSTGGSGGGSSRPSSGGGSGWGSSVSTPITSPRTTHKSYIVGYTDGTFRPDGNMTRAEAAAIFARIVSEEKGEKISGQPKFSDIATDEWYASYIGYIAKYNIVKGYSDGTFRPDEPVTRAELVTMAVRYYGLFNEVQKDGLTVKYTDITSSYWAYSEIAYAKSNGWLNGYADGSFKGDNFITRAETVTVINRATGRTADQEYVNKNLSVLNKFTDMKNNSHWSFYDVAEAANDHLAVSNASGEVWTK